MNTVPSISDHGGSLIASAAILSQYAKKYSQKKSIFSTAQWSNPDSLLSGKLNPYVVQHLIHDIVPQQVCHGKEASP